MTGVKRRHHTDSDICSLHKELDEVSCPICMDHPHNAVLLQCSSHDKGCRSYICDTSHRHSNCLDRFKKLKDYSGSNNATSDDSLPVNSFSSRNISGTSLMLGTRTLGSNENRNLNDSDIITLVGTPEQHSENSVQNSSRQLEAQRGVLEAGDSDRIVLEEADVVNSSDSGLSLKCPLCRGTVVGWEIVEESRKYLNLKQRSCSRESCSFSGNYQELRRHARRVHPTTRPSDVDPSRERAWRYLERQREYGDIVSAIRSAIPGAVLVGDYVIDNSDRFLGDRESGTSDANTPLLTTLFLFQMIGSVDGTAEPRARSRGWTRNRRSGGALPERPYHWGENLLGLQDDDDNNDNDADLHILSDAGEDSSPVPRRRRRLTRSRSDD